MGFLDKNTEIGNKLHKFLEKQESSSGSELREKVAEFFEEHNKQMEEINKKLGDGIGKFIYEAESLINKQHFKGALKVCNKILDAHPTCQEALLMKVAANIAQGNYDEAKDCIGKCKKISGDNPNLQLLMAQIYISKISRSKSEINEDDFKMALKHIDEARKMAPNNFDANMYKSQLLYWLGDKKYTNFVDKCYEIDKKRTENFMKNSWIKELPACHQLIVLMDSMKEADNLMYKRQFEKALDTINEIMKMEMGQKTRENVYSMKIECLVCLEDYEEAEKVIGELIKLNKNYPMPYFNRAIIRFKNLHFNEALDEINKTIEVAEKVNMRHWQYYQLKADILKKFNDGSYKDFEKTAKKLQKEGMDIVKSMAKDSNLSLREFKKATGIK